MQGEEGVSRRGGFSNASSTGFFRMSDDTFQQRISLDDVVKTDCHHLLQPCGPQRSPKTGQWLSPENRPTRMASGTLTPAGACSLRGHGQCLERREETASLSSGTAGMAAAADPEGHPHPS